jgi:hypothetical protein
VDQLLQITNIPIAFEMKINDARLEYRSENAQMEITKGDGGLKIKSQPIKLDIDQFECFNSVNPTVRTSIKDAAQKGKLAAYEATAAYAKEGKLFLNAKVGEDVIGQIAASKLEVNTNVGITFSPSAQPKFNWSQPELNIKYELEKLNFDWKVQNGDFEFVPGNIEISITQQPDVVIEYVGRPLYIPPSSDPNYEAPTTDITV